uniref:Dpy-19 like C-mannosyltransferase 3 n=1 Tax=Scleropages formosus TaxID=113540 RepID=A0A8C9WTP6_SCLFO
FARGHLRIQAEGEEETGGSLGRLPGLAAFLCFTEAGLCHFNFYFFLSVFQEVEREISFRTECGLYYSYYKQMLQAPSVQRGLLELLSDNYTESKRTVNLLQRMNIYQEVLLSILYKVLSIQAYLEPVYFYIYTVFALQAVYVIALYITSWLLSGSWLGGVLAAFWYILNRVDTTRVEFTISLRENWSLPFFALQVAAISWYLRPQLKPMQQKVALWQVFLATLCFCLTWQFNQFIILIQALVVFSLDCLNFIPAKQATLLHVVQGSSLLVVWVMQFFNPMILGSLALSFILGALIIKLRGAGVLPARLGTLLLRCLLVLCFTCAINYVTKKALRLRSDEHIYKFVKAKFGFGSTRDFDANLYLCEEAFGSLPLDTFGRLAGTLVLHPYLCGLCVSLGMVASAALNNLWYKQPPKDGDAVHVRPDVAYNVVHAVFFGILALSTMRMKYLWTGHMCAFAAYSVCSSELWELYLKVIRCHRKSKVRRIQNVVPVVLLAFLCYKFYPKMVGEISELREFYDPDTVELMTWISSKTPKKAVFAGSMQLLAGIKLCTGRVLTNHPHYEDQALRERTRQVYQIYARRSPEDVHRGLRAAGADYAVLEDSICHERRHRRGCRLRDLLDAANGHIMDGPGGNDPDLVPAPYPRFCEEIKKDSAAYARLFIRVFQNKTFHVYKLTKGKKSSKNNRVSSIDA